MLTDDHARKSLRAHLSVTAARVTSPGVKEDRQASVRDISAHGAYIFTDFEPRIGAAIHIEFAVEGILANTRIKCDGKVTRVEKTVAGNLTGIAIEFTHLDMAA